MVTTFRLTDVAGSEIAWARSVKTRNPYKVSCPFTSAEGAEEVVRLARLAYDEVGR